MVLAATDRPDIADTSKATADELRAIWGPLLANAGTYEVSGDLITIHPLVAKIPVVMKPGANEVYRFRIEGKTLTLRQVRNARGVAVCASTAQITSGGRTHPRRLLVELGSLRAFEPGNRSGRSLAIKPTHGGGATMQAVTRVKLEQASKVVMWSGGAASDQDVAAAPGGGAGREREASVDAPPQPTRWLLSAMNSALRILSAPCILHT
jgi:hypothetical protein